MPKEDAMRRNSAGKVINQLPDPNLVNFWQHPLATSQKTEVTIMPREFQAPRGGAPCAHIKPKATTPDRQRAPREAKGTHGSRLSPKSWNQQPGRSPVRDLRQRSTHFPPDEFYDALYVANGKREKVPEAYMIPLPKEDAMRRSSADRMIN